MTLRRRRDGTSMIWLLLVTTTWCLIVAPGMARPRSSSSTILLPPTSFVLLQLVPCAAPRFDTFAEKLQCSWTDERDPTVVVMVEEVMRSCGGAVQGIRDSILLPAPTTTSSTTINDQDSNQGRMYYLNRADDGFVFLDSGAYSFGPTSTINSNDLLPTRTELFASNFMLEPNRRLILTSTSSAETPPSSVIFRKTFGGSLDNDLQAPVLTVATTDSVLRSLSVVWEQSTHCSMPSPGQPWNLPRAKWTTRRVPSTTDTDTTTIQQQQHNSHDDLSTLTCWVSSDETVEDLAQWVGLSQADLGMGRDDFENGTIWFMGVHGSPYGPIQGVARIHDKNGALSNILFLQGKVLQ